MCRETYVDAPDIDQFWKASRPLRQDAAKLTAIAVENAARTIS